MTIVQGERLTEVEWGDMWLYGLDHVYEWSDLREDLVQLSTLVKWWHTLTLIFHLRIGEVIVTLLDMWQILQVPIYGRHPKYVLEREDPYLWEWFG